MWRFLAGYDTFELEEVPGAGGPLSGEPEKPDRRKGGGAMKKMERPMAALLLALLLAGCAAPAEEDSSSAPPPRMERMSSSMVESSARPLPEAEILAAYERAQRVYGWFDLAPLPMTEESASLDGDTYYRVSMPGMENLEDLRTYLRSVFSPELADRLLDEGRIRYRNIQGILYACGEAREPSAGKGGSRVETERLSEDLYSVNVLVELLSEDGESVVGLESWSFPYAFEEDRWVFTDFRLVA